MHLGKSLLVLVGFLFSGLALGQDTIPEKNKKSFLSYFGVTSLDDTIVKDKNGLFFTPLLYYTPDTRWAFGGAGVYSFHLNDRNDPNDKTRTSYIQFLADYTQNRQTDIWSYWSIFTRKEKYLLKGELRFRNFPDRFYGLGNNTSEDAVELYSYDLISFKSQFLKRVNQKIFLGFDYHFSYEFAFKYQAGGVLESGVIPGYQGGIGSGLGLVGILDTRDNVLNAHRGSYGELSSYFYSGVLGSTFDFVNVNGSYIKFWQLKKKHILAWQTKGRFSFGDAPFLDLSTAGGEDMLRGYAKNRYRDRHFFGTQLEYRFPLFWRFGMVTFAGVGDVFAQPSDLSLNTMKYSVGAGLRFLVNTAERVNVRLDYGLGAGGGYFYFSVAEAF